MTTSLKTRRVSLAKLHEDPANARLHDEANLAAIKASLQEFGQVEPLVVQKSTGKVIGGNGRLRAMQALGWKACDIVEVDADDLRATALGITLNRTAELAKWDDGALARLLGQLEGQPVFAATGYDADDLQALLRGLEAGAPQILQEDQPHPPSAKPATRPGDLWRLPGPREHLVLCGDSTTTDLKRLLDGGGTGG